MPLKTPCALLPFLLVPAGLTQPDRQVPAAPLPLDRAADSYAIYSQLLPLGETAGWPANFYAVSDTASSPVPPDAPCSVPTPHTALERAEAGVFANPHATVTPPGADTQEYEEIMQDFDAHCHDRYALQAVGWKTRKPVHLLTEAERKDFESTRMTRDPKASLYKGSPALYSFSPVYFNRTHTTALVYATHWCGGLCGEGFWIAFRKQPNGNWKKLDWAAVSWIS